MDQDREIKRLFYEALGQPKETRLRWLAEVCGDQGLREAVEALLRRDPGTSEFLEPPSQPGLPSLDQPGDLEVPGFELLSVLGKGASATVFLARDRRLNRDVALKVVTPPPLDAGAQLARFRQGAEIQAKLNHPRIVPIYQVGEAQGRHFIAMAYVPGRTLADLLGEYRSKKITDAARAQRDRALANMLSDMAEALDHAHRAGIIHRDVKPSNIIIDEQRQSHLIDFGIAKDDAHEDLTEEGSLLGTLRYMSPEQAKGAAKIKLDARSDVFSLGVVLYEAISLVQPFTGDSVQEILNQVISKDAVPLRRLCPSMAPDLDIIVQKAMEKEPEHRYQSAMHLAADLRSFVSGDPILAQRPALARRLRRRLKRHRYLLAAAGLLVLGLSLGLALRKAQPQPMGSILLEIDGQAAARVSLLPVVYLEQGALAQESLGEAVYSEHIGAQQSERIELVPGAYRIVVSARDGAYADLGVVVNSGAEEAYRLRPSPEQAEFPEMVSFAPRGSAAFALDREEVDNGRFRRFLSSLSAQDAARLEPLWWGVTGYKEEWDSLPVSGITQAAAVRFAAWDGKRLPSAAEWTLAAGLEGTRSYPWGERAPAEGLFAAQASQAAFAAINADLSPERLEALLQEYLGAVRAVADFSQGAGQPDDVSPEGLVNLFSNVAEWTSSLPPVSQVISEQAQIEYRLIKGMSWASRPFQPLEPEAYRIDLARNGQIGLGFRCARTLR